MHQALQKQIRFENHVSAALAESGEIRYTLVLRTVNFNQDLEFFFRWMEDADLQANWGLKENSYRLT